MIKEEIGYRSFLLRLWIIKHNGKHIWRASMEIPRSGEQQSFSSLDELIRFLQNLLEIMENEVEKQAGQ